MNDLQLNNPPGEVLLRQRAQRLVSAVEVELLALQGVLMSARPEHIGLTEYRALRRVEAGLRAAVDEMCGPVEPRNWLEQPD